MDYSAKLDADRDRDVAQILEIVNDLRQKGISYWSEDQTLIPMVESMEGAIIGRLHFLTNALGNLFESTSDFGVIILETLNAFDEALTGGDFETASRTADPRRFKEIEITSFSLMTDVAKYRRKMRREWLVLDLENIKAPSRRFNGWLSNNCVSNRIRKFLSRQKNILFK